MINPSYFWNKKIAAIYQFYLNFMKERTDIQYYTFVNI
jgi:LAS superfamily LD-carboxypeptidase LdcB